MNFIFANLNTITLVIWLAFFCIVATRAFRSAWIKDISYGWLVCAAVNLHLLYGALATWGQYSAWGKSEFTKIFLSTPLSKEVPLPMYFEWARTFFEYPHGYFVFYSFQHFFLSTIALLIIVGLFYLFLVARARYRSFNFREGDIMLIVLAMLISGWPGVIVLLPIGLACAILLSLCARIFYGIERIPLPPAFLLAAPIALLFAIPILTVFHLYPLLKL